LRIPLKHLLAELLESILHFDLKTIRTAKLLLLKPGYLSREFNSGKRADYVPPVRLYVLISFVFFFLLSLLSGVHKEDAVDTANQGEKKGMTVSYGGIVTSDLAGLPFNKIDSVMAARQIEPSNFNTMMVRQMHKMANRSAGEFSHFLMKNISYMMFLLMPVFGAWIYVFNKKQIRYYIESLVISIHFHSFIFLMFTVLLLVSSLAGMELFFFLGFLIVPLYILLMLRGVLKQKWFLTIGKTALIGMLYLASLLGFLLLTILISVMFV
jgi:hypothetical protein